VSELRRNTHVCGRAKMVLVTDRGDGQKAVVSAIVVRRIEGAGKRRLRFGGTVKFSESIKRHIRRTLLPIVDNIAGQLGLPPKCFEIAGVNLGAASSLDVGISISGLSADLPAFIAMLSQAVQIPLRDDFVATGHIASPHGDITAVKGIPAKLEAATNDGSINRFIYPNVRDDVSLKVVSPSQRERSIIAVMSARDVIQTTAVRDIDELVREVFAEEDVLLGSLREDFFDVSSPQSSSDSISKVLSYLTGDNEKRFWNTLQRYFTAGMSDEGKELLEAYAAFFISRQRYPASFGAKLFQLICSVPPQVRRLKVKFPILNKAVCTEIVRLMRQKDCDDVALLFDATLGRHIVHEDITCRFGEQSVLEPSDTDCVAFDAITSMINEPALVREVDIFIDSARGSYMLTSSTVDTFEEFLDTLQAFYIHLERCISPDSAQELDAVEARQRMIALLNRTFQDRGGHKAAFVIAREGTKGGMRSLLDALTERFKAERRAAYIQRIFKDAFDTSNWDESVRFMRGAMKRLAPFLPEEMRNEPAERFAENWEPIIQAYVQSLDGVGQLLKTM
jgi:hypothetical protein